MVGLKSYSQCAVAPYAVAFVSQCQGRTEMVSVMTASWVSVGDERKTSEGDYAAQTQLRHWRTSASAGARCRCGDALIVPCKHEA